MQRSSISTFIFYALAGIVACLVAAMSSDAATEPLGGRWEGTIDVPSQPLQIMVDFQEGESGWSGTIDIPMQGAQGLQLEIFSVTSERVQFRIVGVPGDPTFDGERKAGTIEGTFTQGGANLTFSLGREALAKPQRPQEPTAPFPYTEEETRYTNGDIQLAGTLTLPPGAGPHPAVVLISGSGSQNRDSELMGHKPFWILADHLTRDGIAVLRVDDRGVGDSTGKGRESTSSDFADDALAGVRWLQKHPRIAPERVGLIGHSEGGLIAPIAASRSEKVAFIVLLAGPGVPTPELLALQVELIARAQGVPEAQIRKVVETNQITLKQLARSESDTTELRNTIEELVLAQDPEAKKDPENFEKIIDAELRKIDNPWFRYFVDYDPSVALKQVKVPVLALNGSLDLQVDAKQNLPSIERALKEGGNEDVTIETLPGLNHLFQPAETGAVSEYAQIETTFAPAALDRIATWINERFAKSGS